MVNERYYQFSGSLSDIQDKVTHLRERADAMGELATKLDGTSHQTALTELAALYASFSGCMSLLAANLPYKAGDRVRLVVAPKCEGGWSHSKHFLVVGAIGTVKFVQLDYLMRDWSVFVEFDDESWITSITYGAHRAGDIVKVGPDDRHVYGFAPRYVEKI